MTARRLAAALLAVSGYSSGEPWDAPRAHAISVRTQRTIMCPAPRSVVGLGAIEAGGRNVSRIFREFSRTSGRMVLANATLGGRQCCDETIHYWRDDQSVNSGVDAYCRFFATTRATVATYEASPSYSYQRNVPINLLAVVPQKQVRAVFNIRPLGPWTWERFSRSKAEVLAGGFTPFVERLLRTMGRTLHCLTTHARSRFPYRIHRIAHEGNRSAHPLVCDVLADAPHYVGFAHDTRSSRGCPGDHAHWVLNLLHWVRLLGEEHVLLVPHDVLVRDATGVRRALWQLAGFEGEPPPPRPDARTVSPAPGRAPTAAEADEMERAEVHLDVWNGVSVQDISGRLWGHGQPAEARSIIGRICEGHDELYWSKLQSDGTLQAYYFGKGKGKGKGKGGGGKGRGSGWNAGAMGKGRVSRARQGGPGG